MTVCPASTTALDHIHPRLRLKINPRARRFALRLDGTGGIVNLVVPPRFDIRKAEKFALEYREWIAKKLAALPTPVPFEHGAILPILGTDRVLDIRISPEIRRTRILMDEQSIRVATALEDPTARIVRYLKKEAENALGALACEKAGRIGRKIKGIRITDTKSRWGSCGSDGSLCLSWRLILAPPPAMDYVVSHEAAHLVHMNHGRQFWSLCEELCDDYHSGKNWIRMRGHELMRYGITYPDKRETITDHRSTCQGLKTRAAPYRQDSSPEMAKP